MHWALKNIVKMSDGEISDMLNEIRLEKAMVAELQATPNIIKKTGIFDKTDRIYGDYAAMMAMENGQMPQQQGEDDSAGTSGGAGGEGFDGGSLNMDSLGGGGEDVSGTDVSSDMSSAPSLDTGGQAPTGQQISENIRRMKKSAIDEYLERMGGIRQEKETAYDFELKSKTINEEVKSIFDNLSSVLDDNEEDDDDDEDDDEDFDICK
jgi:hypothetical protein